MLHLVTLSNRVYQSFRVRLNHRSFCFSAAPEPRLLATNQSKSHSDRGTSCRYWQDIVIIVQSSFRNRSDIVFLIPAIQNRKEKRFEILRVLCGGHARARASLSLLYLSLSFFFFLYLSSIVVGRLSVACQFVCRLLV